MTRNLFGGTTSDNVWTAASVRAANGNSVSVEMPSAATVLFYDAQTAGNQITDLQDLTNAPISQVAVDASGDVPMFYGPDGVTQMWASANGGPRRLIVSLQAAANAVTNAQTSATDASASASAAASSATDAANSASTAQAAASTATAPTDSMVAGLVPASSGSATSSALAAAIAAQAVVRGAVSIDLNQGPYNAKPGTDITAALQQAINDLATGGQSGEIYFSQAGTYNINGAQQTGTVLGYSYSGQILFPGVDSTKSLAIKIRGAASPSVGGSGRINNGTILQSNATSGWIFDAIPAYTAFGAQYPWTNVVPIFEDVIVQGPIDPQCGGVKATICPSFKMARSQFSPSNLPGATPTGTLEAVALPQVQNAGDITLRDTNIRGWGMGIRLTEHATLSSVRVAFCGAAFVSNGGAHGNVFERVNAENNATLFKMEALVNGPLTIDGVLDIENSSITPAAFSNYASGFASIRGNLRLYTSYPSGGLPLITPTVDDSPLGKLGITNVGEGGAGGFNQHPSDDFTRMAAPITTGAPGLSWPTLHPWRVIVGSFKTTGTAGSPGQLYSTNGTSQSLALLPCKGGGESRTVSTTFTLAASGWHLRQMVNYVISGSHSFHYLGVDIGSDGSLSLKGYVAAGLVTYKSVSGVFAGGGTYTVATKVLMNPAQQPTTIKVYVNGVLKIVYTLSAADTAYLSQGAAFPYLMDGISMYEQNSYVTKFAVTPATPDPTALSSGTATLATGTVTVADTNITASSVVRVNRQAAGGTLGELSVALNAGTGFTINSSSATDTSTVYYEVVSY